MLARRAAREAAACGIESLYANCVPCTRFVRGEPWHGIATSPTGAGGAGSAGGARCGAWVAPPVLWQSWYHLFLPRWLAAGERLLLAFSDDLLRRPEIVMTAVARHLRLPPHAFDLHLAYNTKRKRGLHWWGRANAVPRDRATPRHAGAPTLNASEAGASEATVHSLRRLMAPSVRSLDELLRAASRPGVPTQWLEAGMGRGRWGWGGGLRIY